MSSALRQHAEAYYVESMFGDVRMSDSPDFETIGEAEQLADAYKHEGRTNVRVYRGRV